VVGVPQLLEVMASDVPAVSGRVQRLLLPSLLPDAEQGPALMAALLRSQPAAGRAFCAYLVGQGPAGSGVESGEPLRAVP
jgi:hypothetical protein